MSPEQSIGHYRIVSKLGEGGMRWSTEPPISSSTTMSRSKCFRKLFSGRGPHAALRTGRQVLAALNHPNIAAIYGVEENAFVMELVEGESLRTVLKRGSLPIETVLSYAAQIAEALEAAHEKSVVHRDLTPANSVVTPSRVVHGLHGAFAKFGDDTVVRNAGRRGHRGNASELRREEGVGFLDSSGIASLGCTMSG